MSARSFTILETVLAAILAMLLMIGSVGVIQNMQRETARFKTQVDNDTTWMTANIHLAKMVRSSSYLELPNPNTLILRNYNNSEKGRYVYNANSHRIEYWVNNNTTLQATFNNVEATFALKAGAQRNGQSIEAIINYTRPFANMLYLRCAVATPGPASTTWAMTYYSAYELSSVDLPGPGPKIRQTKDGGYIAAATVRQTTPFNFYAYLLRIDKDGKHKWSRILNVGQYTSGMDVWEDPGGGTFVMLCGSTSTMRLVRFDNNGNVILNRNLGISYPISMSQTSDGGYIVVGETQNWSASPYIQYCFVVKVNRDLNIQWSAQVQNRFCPSPSSDMMHVAIMPSEIIETFSSKAGASTGYVLVGTLISPAQLLTYQMGWPNVGVTATVDAGTKRVGFLVKLNSSGLQEWYQTYWTPGSVTGSGIAPTVTAVPTEYAASVIQTFDSTGNANGYLMGGYSYEVSGPSFIRKTNTSGAMSWIRSTKNSGSMITSITPITTNAYILADTNLNFGVGGFLYQGAIRKLDANFNVLWDKVYNGGVDLVVFGSPALWSSTRFRAIPTSDGGYVLFGSEINSAKREGLTGYNERLYLIKTDADGNCSEAPNPQRVANSPAFLNI